MENSTGSFSNSRIMARTSGGIPWARPHQVQSAYLVSACLVQLQYSVLSDTLLAGKHLPAMFAVTLLIGCTGFYLGKLQIGLPLYIDVSMTALPFYVAGFWIRRYNFFLFPSHRFDKLIPAFVLLALVVMYFYCHHTGNAHKQLFRKYFPSLHRSICRNIHDYVTLQESEKGEDCFLSGAIFYYHVEYPWTYTPFLRSIGCTIHS